MKQLKEKESNLNLIKMLNLSAKIGLKRSDKYLAISNVLSLKKYTVI